MAMLELAIVLPLLLLVLFGSVELGLAFARFQVISNAAREGARQGALYREVCDPGGVASEVRGAVQRYAAGQLGIGPGDLEVQVSGACAAGETTVRVAYRHRFVSLPKLGGVRSAVDLIGRSVMRNEI
jgi:hypothetical protein